MIVNQRYIYIYIIFLITQKTLTIEFIWEQNNTSPSLILKSYALGDHTVG